jgi:hypothetical protein
MRLRLLLIACLTLSNAPALAALDPDDPPADAPADPPADTPDPAPASQDAATMLGDRGKTPDQREDSSDTPTLQQSDNAGRLDTGSAPVTETHSETTVTESSSTSFSVGTPVSNDNNAPAPGWGGGGGGGKPTADGMKGSWTLRSGDGRSSCTVKLGDDKWGDLYGAWTPSDCPKGIFQVARWGPDGRGIRMTDNMGRTLVEFQPSGPDRFVGAMLADGQKMILSR